MCALRSSFLCRVFVRRWENRFGSLFGWSVWVLIHISCGYPNRSGFLQDGSYLELLKYRLLLSPCCFISHGTCFVLFFRSKSVPNLAPILGPHLGSQSGLPNVSPHSGGTYLEVQIVRPNVGPNFGPPSLRWGGLNWAKAGKGLLHGFGATRRFCFRVHDHPVQVSPVD